MITSQLNYKHLYYFWVVAKEGNLTRAAQKLFIVQSALSIQIKKLENQIGHQLFKKQGRSLVLTEAGKLTLNYAEKIFTLGNELNNVLQHKLTDKRTVVKVGLNASLSRNFVENLIRPLLDRADIEMSLVSESDHSLLSMLDQHELDLVLTNNLPTPEKRNFYQIKTIAKQQLSIVGIPINTVIAEDFETIIKNHPLLIPGINTEIRRNFDQLCQGLNLKYKVLAEISDMPALRLLARDSGNAALLPIVVVQDEIMMNTLQEYCKVPNLFENFYGITIKTEFEHEAVSYLLSLEQPFL